MPLACFLACSPEPIVNMCGIINSTRCQVLEYFSPKTNCLAKETKAKTVAFIHTYLSTEKYKINVKVN